MIEAVALYFVSEDCGPWANFLKTKLGEKAYDIQVHEIEAANTADCQGSYKANIILASPAFLELPSYEHFCSFPKTQSLVVLLGVEDSEYEETLKEKEAEQILGFPLFETEANESSVRCLLVEIIDLYERNVAPEDLMRHSETDPYDFPPAPKPVSGNELQKFIIDEKDSKLYLVMERKDEENILVQDERKPDVCVQCKYLGNALYEASLTDDFHRSQSLRIVTTKRRNVASVNLDSISKAVPGDKLSQIQNLLQEELDPLAVLCQALRLPEVSVSCLDKFLAEKCSNFKMFDTLKSLSLGDSINEKHPEESNWPTLLHFGAEMGLSLFCDELIKVPGMDKFCHVTNALDETPGQLARNRGFLKLAEKLDMLTVTQRDKRSSPANKDSGISDMRTSNFSQISDTNSYAPSCRTVDSLLEDDPYQMPPPTPHQPNQYYINSNKADVSRSDEVFEFSTTDQKDGDVPPPPPPKMKSSPAACQLSCRPPMQSQRDSLDSRMSEDSRMSTNSSLSTDSRVTLTSETSVESVTSVNLRMSTGSQSSTDSSDDTTVTDYVDMASTSSYMGMNSVKRKDSKTKSKPPQVLPRPNRSSASDSKDKQGTIPTFDDELDSGSSSSEYMPMNDVPKHLKQSRSESSVNKHLAPPRGEDDYMSPTEVSPKPSPRTSLTPSHEAHSPKHEVLGQRPTHLQIGENRDSEVFGPDSRPVPHYRSVSESGARQQGGFHRIGSPISPLAQDPISEKSHNSKRESTFSKKYRCDDDMIMSRGQGFFSKLKSKMGGGGAGKRKMSCPPEAIKESLDKFNQRNQNVLAMSANENRVSTTSTSSSSSHSSFHESQTLDEPVAGEVSEVQVRQKTHKKGLFGGKKKSDKQESTVRRKSVRIDKMKKDKNLQLLELPAKRK